MANQYLNWDSFVEPMEEVSVNFDNQQHQISRSSNTWHELTNTSCSSNFSNYSELFKVFSSVPLQTSPTRVVPEVFHGGERIFDEGESIGGKRKHEEIELAHFDFKRQENSSASKSKKSENEKGSKQQRCPETHNKSERRRRDRIRDKMKELQELIPNGYQANRAAMLDAAIEYLKTLKQQVQVMSMGASVPSPPQYNMPMPQFQNMHIPDFAQPLLPKMDFNSVFRTGINSPPVALPVVPVQPLPIFSSSGFVSFSPPQMHLNLHPMPSHQLPNIQTPFPSSAIGGFLSLTQATNHNKSMSKRRQASSEMLR